MRLARNFFRYFTDDRNMIKVLKIIVTIEILALGLMAFDVINLPWYVLFAPILLFVCAFVFVLIVGCLIIRSWKG